MQKIPKNVRIVRVGGAYRIQVRVLYFWWVTLTVGNTDEPIQSKTVKACVEFLQTGPKKITEELLEFTPSTAYERKCIDLFLKGYRAFRLPDNRYLIERRGTGWFDGWEKDAIVGYKIDAQNTIQRAYAAFLKTEAPVEVIGSAELEAFTESL